MITTLTFTIDHAALTVDAADTLLRVTKQALSSGSYAPATWGAVVEAVRQSSVDCITIKREAGWIAGWNIPGYLPDDEPQAFATFAEAHDYLIEELNRGMECRLGDLTSSDDSKAAGIRAVYTNALKRLGEQPAGTDTWVQCGKHVWWLRREA